MGAAGFDKAELLPPGLPLLSRDLFKVAELLRALELSFSFALLANSLTC